MKKAIASFLLTLAACYTFAGTPANNVMYVTGHVTDRDTHETLAGVEVKVKGTSIVAYTDFNGNFFLPELTRGSYELEFNYITYTATQIVTDNCDHCSDLSVELTQR